MFSNTVPTYGPIVLYMTREFLAILRRDTQGAKTETTVA
jgi:hypothetical protein